MYYDYREKNYEIERAWQVIFICAYANKRCVQVQWNPFMSYMFYNEIWSNPIKGINF